MLPSVFVGGMELVQTGCLLACQRDSRASFSLALWHVWPQPHFWAQLKAGSEPERLGDSQRSWCGGEGLAGENAPESP